jgi:RNA polymerase sigma-70 factor (ECF subfamily)
MIQRRSIEAAISVQTTMMEGRVTSGVCADPRQEQLKSLIEQVARGHHPALSELYDRSSSVVYSLALRILANSQDAEEAVHDVYCRAWRTASSYAESRGSVMTWLVMMTRSIAIDRLRASRKHAAPATDDWTEPQSAADSPEAEAVSNQRARRIRAALETLSEEQRELIELAFFAGISHSELAANLGLPLGTVKTRIRTGLSRLRTFLEDLEA